MNGSAIGWTSPPGVGPSSNSTRSSSLPSSFQLDEGGILNNLGHFEDIGLDDEKPRSSTNGVNGNGIGMGVKPLQRSNTTGLSSLRDLTLKRTPYPLGGSASSALSIDHLTLPNGSRKMSNSSSGRRSRTSSPSPIKSAPGSPGLPATSSPSVAPLSSSRRSYTTPIPKRALSARRKTAAELEKECDSDGDDELPPDAIICNVPVSPRLSRNFSASTSPTREYANGSTTPKGPPPRSPTWSGSGAVTPKSAIDDPRGRPLRSRSWNDNIVDDLSPEVRELTEKLEEFAEEEMVREEKRRQKMMEGGAVKVKAKSYPIPAKKKTIDLPPLQMSNGMIDPLPISKEKEAVLSRTRPSWLPPKSKEEEKRHLKEYQKMMQMAREAERKKAEKERLAEEQRERMKVDIHRLWEHHILPEWDQVVQKPETRELWWQGIAPRCRSAVWEKALGNHLAATEETFRIALQRAKELEKGKGSLQTTKEQEMFAAIRRDVGDTFPDLKIFQEHGPLHESLRDILYAYSMYRSDVGYVYGTHVIAAILLLNQTAVKAFISFVNLLNRPVPLAFYTQDEAAMQKVYSIFLRAFSYKLPALYHHIHHTLQLPPPAYLEAMFLTLFSLHCPLDITSRLWDVYMFEGDAFLVRTAIGVLTVLEPKLYGSREEVIGLLGWRAGVWSLGKEDEFLEIVRGAGKLEYKEDGAMMEI